MLELVIPTVEIKINGNVHTLKMPNSKQEHIYKNEIEKLKDDSVAVSEFVVTYFNELGLPKEVGETLDTDQLLDIIKYITSSKKKSTTQT